MGASIMELECTSIQMEFESRPRSSGLTFGLSVAGLQLLDTMTEGTLFPVLVGCQNKVFETVSSNLISLFRFSNNLHQLFLLNNNNNNKHNNDDDDDKIIFHKNHIWSLF